MSRATLNLWIYELGYGTASYNIYETKAYSVIIDSMKYTSSDPMHVHDYIIYSRIDNHK